MFIYAYESQHFYKNLTLTALFHYICCYSCIFAVVFALTNYLEISTLCLIYMYVCIWLHSCKRHMYVLHKHLVSIMAAGLAGREWRFTGRRQKHADHCVAIRILNKSMQKLVGQLAGPFVRSSILYVVVMLPLMALTANITNSLWWAWLEMTFDPKKTAVNNG